MASFFLRLFPALALLAVALMPTGALAKSSAPKALTTYDLTPLLSEDMRDGSARRHLWDEMQIVAALQGLVNRKEPRLYVFLVGPGGRIDHYWLDKLRAPGQWLAASQFQPVTDIETLLARFRRDYKGVVVWDERVPATSNVASTVAGVEDLLPVRYDPAPDSLYTRLVRDPKGPRLPERVRLLAPDNGPLFTGRGTIPGTHVASSGSAKCDALLWAVEHYLKTGKCDPACLAYYPDAYWLAGKSDVPPVRTLLSNHDYFIAHRGFFFDLGPWDDEAPNDDPTQPLGTDLHTLQTILRAAYDQTVRHPGVPPMIQVGGFTPWDQKYTEFTGGRHGGVATEWRYAEILSCYNAYMDADAPALNAMANASLYQHFPLAASYPQPAVTEADLRVLGDMDAQDHVVPKNYATFYVGDYDSSAWLYQRLPDLWDDPARGSVPLGWAFNPTLAARFPVGLAYTRATATANDSFVAGDSGAGYLNPGDLVPPRTWSGLPSGLAAWEAHCRREYARWGLAITGFVIDGNAPPMSDEVKAAYARFSPGGVVAQKVPPQSLVQGVPFLRMGADLSDPEQGAQAISAAFPPPLPGATGPAAPQFHIFRTILWSPTQHRDLVERLQRERPDIEIVAPAALFALLRRALESSAVTSPRH